MHAWPSTLPPLPQLPATSTLQGGVIRTPNDIGPELTRRRTTTTAEPFQFDLVLRNLTQLLAFRTFFLSTIQGGALPFAYDYFGTLRAMRFRSDPEIEDLGADIYRAHLDLNVMGVVELLLLEGDVGEGELLLEGDVQTGSDRLMLGSS